MSGVGAGGCVGFGVVVAGGAPIICTILVLDNNCHSTKESNGSGVDLLVVAFELLIWHIPGL